MTTEYRPVFQTWNMLRSPTTTGTPPVTATSEDVVKPTMEESTRHTIQKLRIQKRMSIAELAEAVHCDVETLAAYERGDEVLDAAIVKTIERTLSRS